MRIRKIVAGALVPACTAAVWVSAVSAQEVFWGVQAEQAEIRFGEDGEIGAWDFDAFVGTDELRFVWRSEAEYSFEEDVFETLENQARVQVPISDFLDAVAGVRVDTPDGDERVLAVLGLHGLAPQWFEVDADFFIGEASSFRGEAEYEALITNRIILTPSIEVDLPFNDDDDLGVGAFAPTIEIGARVSYDLIDRAVAPYIGVHYEAKLGETGNRAQAEGEDSDAVFFVAGVRLMF